jgi:hypothetical protein
VTTDADLYRRGVDTLLAFWAARAGGGRTASLQATPMAERLYARLGFRGQGRIIEYVPPARADRLADHESGS